MQAIKNQIAWPNSRLQPKIWTAPGCWTDFWIIWISCNKGFKPLKDSGEKYKKIPNQQNINLDIPEKIKNGPFLLKKAFDCLIFSFIMQIP